MAIHKGNDGTVRVGSNVIAHITSYTSDDRDWETTSSHPLFL